MAAPDPRPAGDESGTRRRLRARVEGARAAAELRFPAITELSARLLSVNLLDAATRLAAQLFLTAVPFMFVAAAFTPASVRSQLLTSARDVFGLSGASEDQLRQLYAASGTGNDTVRQTTGAIGALIALVSATASSRAMARVCERAWQLPRSSVRVAAWRWFAWIVAWVAVLVLQGPLRNGLGAGLWLGIPLMFVADAVVWWWTQRLLLGSRVPWVMLAPGALLTSLAMTVLSVTARLYMPTALDRSLATYGPLGSVFTVLSWLIALCVVLTFSITAGAVLATRPPLAQPLQDAMTRRGRGRGRRGPGRVRRRGGNAGGGTDDGAGTGEDGAASGADAVADGGTDERRTAGPGAGHGHGHGHGEDRDQRPDDGAGPARDPEPGAGSGQDVGGGPGLTR